MRIIVVGCGRMGTELSLELSHLGHEVTVVDHDPLALTRLGEGFRGRRVVGVGFDREVLRRSGVERSDALAALTAGDNTNIVTARVAQYLFHVPKVVARVYDPRRAAIYQRLGVPTVSTTVWGVHRVIQLLAHRELNVIRAIGQGELELVEQEVPPSWVSRAVSHIAVPGEISVTAVLRRNRAFLPSSGTVFEAGDRAVIAVIPGARGKLESLLGLR